MLSGPLSLLIRSIRQDARTRRAHAVRLAAVILILVLLLSAQFSTGPLAAPGLVFFFSISMLAMILITLAAVGHFSTAISEEAEEGTLGLLLMANLSPVAILLGKSTNRVISAWLVFIAQFPFALLALTLGGVTVWQIVVVYVALAMYLYLVANLALLASVFSRKTSNSMALTTLFLLVLHATVPIIHQTVDSLAALRVLPYADQWSVIVAGLTKTNKSISTGFEIYRILDPQLTPSVLTIHNAFCLIVGTLAFVLSWSYFRRTILIADFGDVVERRSWSFGSWRLGGRPNRSWKLALIWKDYHFIAGGTSFVILKIAAFAVLFLLAWQFEKYIVTVFGMQASEVIRVTCFSFAVVELLMLSSRIFHVERRWGTLPTLAMLPLSTSRISWQKAAGCLLVTVPSWLAVLASCYMPSTAGSRPLVLRPEEIVIGFCLSLVVAQLTVVCSLRMAWGALPMAIAISVVSFAVLSPLLTGAMFISGSRNYASATGIEKAMFQVTPYFYMTFVLSLGLQMTAIELVRKAAASDK